MVGVAMVGLDESLDATPRLARGPSGSRASRRPSLPCRRSRSCRRARLPSILTSGRSESGCRSLGVIGLEPLAEVDAGIEPLDLFDEEDRGEMGRAFGEDVAARSLAGRQDVAPPLVRRLVGGDLEGGVNLRATLRSGSRRLRKT